MTRRPRAALTYGGRFAGVWPEVSHRLERSLVCRGVDPHTASDLAQEVAVRALQHEVDFDSADDLYPWALVVARRLQIDLHRRSARVVLESTPEPTAREVGPATTVESRLRLEAVAASFGKLSALDQEAIVSAFAPAEATTEPGAANRWFVRRHRARARLSAMVGELWLLVGALIGAVTAAISAARRRSGGAVALPASVAVIVAVALSVAQRPYDTPLEDPSTGRGKPTTFLAETDPTASVPRASGPAVLPRSQHPTSDRKGMAPPLPIEPDVSFVDPTTGRERGGRIREGTGTEPLACVASVGPVTVPRTCVPQPVA